MIRKEKLLAKLMSGKSDKGFTFKELASLLQDGGWRLDRVKGSHHSFVNESGMVITLPKKRPQMKPVYARKVRNLIQSS